MSAWGAGQGFAQGFATQFAKGLEVKYKEEQDEARVAADRYKMDKDAFLKSEKEDKEKVNQAEQLIESLYPKADKRNKNARTIDALNMLRANISYEQVKKDMEARVYEELKEEQKTERKENVVSSDINDQTNELIADADKALNDTGFEGEAKDTSGDTEFKEEEKDESGDNIFQKVGGLFTKEGRAERRDNRLDRRIEGLTGADAEKRRKVSQPYVPTLYTGESGTIFSRTKDDEKIPQYQKITSVTASNVNSYIAASEQNNDPVYKKIYEDLAVIYTKDEKEDLPESMAEVSAHYARLSTKKTLAKPGTWTEEDENEFKIAEQTYNNMINISVQVERVKDIKPVVLKRVNENGTVEFKDATVRPGNDLGGSKDVWIPSDNSGIITMTEDNGGWETVTDQESKKREKILSSNDAEITKYRADLSSNLSGLEMVTEIVSLVEQSKGQVLTSASNLAVVGERAIAETATFLTVMNGYFSDKGQVNDEMFTDGVDEKGDPLLTQQSFEQNMMAEGVLKPGETLDDLVERLSGTANLDLATQKQLFESKLLLAAFRMGRLEGQQGNAMSNRDFEKLMQIIRPTKSNVGVFKTQISDYFGGRINILNSQADFFNQNNGGDIQSFTTEYGYNPYINGTGVVYIEDYLNNPKNRGATDQMRNGYNFIINMRGNKTDIDTKYVPNSIKVQGVPDTAIGILKDGMDDYSDEELKTFFIGKYGEDKYNEVMGNK